MSHFTNIQTCFQNILYLEKALSKLKISYIKKESNTSHLDSKKNNENLLIPQKNNHNIEFNWTGNQYELVMDLSFWDQPYSIESFIDKISQNYASAVIIGESKKSSFQLMKSKQNVDGSNTLILERWSK